MSTALFPVIDEAKPAPVRSSHHLLVRLVAMLTLAAAIFVGTSVHQSEEAEALTWGGCSWTGTCSVHLSRWETESFAVAGAAFLVARGVPWFVAVAVERAGDWAASNGYCLSIGYNIFTHMVYPGYYRC